MDIETIYPDAAQTGSAIGLIVVREVRNNVTIDFEEFEVLYLTVRVRDEETVYGDDFDECKYQNKAIFLGHRFAEIKAKYRYD